MRCRLSSLSSVVLVALVAAGALGLAGCGPSTDSASPASASASATPPAISPSPWGEARASMGKTATFSGPVVATIYEKAIKGHPTFLNIGVDYPDPARLTVVIWEKDRAAFPEPPEDMYAGKTIRVTGTVTEYQKAPAIEISSPDGIEVLD